MRRPLLAALALLAASAAGCSSNGLTPKDVELTIRVDASFADAEIATVKTLDVAAVGGKTVVTTIPLTRPLARTERIVVHFSSASGMVQVSALARDANSGVVLRGVTSLVNLADQSGPHPATLTLYAPATGAHAPSGFTLTPTEFSLFTGQTVTLEVKDEASVWSADDGGTIDDSGLFTPPGAGHFHPTATSTLYPTDKASATVNVFTAGITRYAGGLGGAGVLDGTGTAARVAMGPGMAVVGNSLYFTELTQTVRRADLTTGEVVTIAGQADHSIAVDGTGTAAAFQTPWGVASDGSKVWVSDTYCPCIRAITAAGVVTTLAGKQGMTGTTDGVGAAAMFGNPMGLVYDSGKHLLYVSDVNLIRSVDVTTGAVVTIAGHTGNQTGEDGPAMTASFQNASALVLDGGTLYVLDASNNIRKLDLGAKTVSTAASNLYSNTLGPAGSGKLALTNPARVLDVATGAVTVIQPPKMGAIYDYGNSIAMEDDGSFWLGGYFKLERYDAASQKLSAFAGFDGVGEQSVGTRATAGLDGLNSFAVRPSDGAIFARDSRIVRIDPATSNVSLVQPPSSGGGIVQGDGDMVFGSDGALYAADRNQHVIFRLDVDHGGGFTGWAGAKGQVGSADGAVAASSFNGPEGMTVDGDMIYLTDQHNSTIRGINVKTGTVSTIAGAAGMCGFVDMPGAAARFCNPDGIAADGAGNLYVSDNNAIRKIVIAGGVVSTLVKNNGLGSADGPSGTASLWVPFRMAIDPAKKYVYFSELGNDAIRRVDLATGVVSTIAGGPGKAQIVEGPLPGGVNQPGVLGFAKSGDLLVTVPRESSLVQIRLP